MAGTRRKVVPVAIRSDPEIQVALLAGWRAWRTLFTPMDDLSTIPPELLEQLQGMAAQHQATWPDQSLPALDGMTPRAASRDRRMKPPLALLLKDMETRDAIARACLLRSGIQQPCEASGAGHDHHRRAPLVAR